MGSHLIDGQFQSDKYPTVPRDFMPVKFTDKRAQDLLWEMALRYRDVDAELAEDMQARLRAAGYEPMKGLNTPKLGDTLIQEAHVRVETLRQSIFEMFHALEDRKVDIVDIALAVSVPGGVVAADDVDPSGLGGGDHCLLCTSPVPANRDDANTAYLAGYADGALVKARGEHRTKLCAKHSGVLRDLLERYGLTLDLEAIPARVIPVGLSIENAYLHCSQCVGNVPHGQSPKSWARLNVGFTELGFQVWCVRHNLNVLHIDFQGHQHPASSRPR